MASCVRDHQPALARQQLPKQSLQNMVMSSVAQFRLLGIGVRAALIRGRSIED